MSTGCDGCFVDQRSINEKFQQAITDAQKLADKEKIKVAVYQNGQGFNYKAIGNGSLPGGTRKVVEPMP